MQARAIALDGVLREGTRPPERANHLFTVDVEEYFHVSAFEGVIRREQWRTLPSRVEVGLERLLDLLAARGVTATFFMLGWVARHHPHLVSRILSGGHELASHGWGHERVTTIDRTRFRQDVRDAKRLLEDLAGRPVVGYRAPSFSITRQTEWALDVLVEEGYAYDSSLYPVRRPGYGHPDARPEPHRVVRASGVLLEFPPATFETVLGIRLPAGGGGTFRHFPFHVTRAAFEQLESRGHCGTFYIHPWELDPGQPRVPVSRLTSVRHYRGIDSVAAKIDRLLARFSFTSIADALARGTVQVPGPRCAQPLPC